MSRLPLQTSYFSVNVFLSGMYMMRTAIALDIVRQYYYKQKYNGENLKTIIVNGYGELIDFEELCLGTWMVFDKLYGVYPPDIQIFTGEYLVGWNREVTDPTVDIPMALRLYEQLVAPAASYNDKWSRMETIQKLFYKVYHPNQRRFFSIDDLHYEVLKDINPPFYQWILDNIEKLNKLIEQNMEYQKYTTVNKEFVFDIKPFAEFYDDIMTANLLHTFAYDMNNGLLLANKFYMTFLTAFEQILYGYTKHVFPMKLYATIGYVFNIHMKLLMDFLKPYHAKLIEKDPTFYFGNDIFDSVVVGDHVKKEITQQFIDSIIHTKFDNARQVENSFDKFNKIREKIHFTVL